jgi:TetR/AcrR family transcriptional regulator
MKLLDQSKRDEILDAALKVFAEVGFKEATVRQICKKAKANVCLVSYYFNGKEGLYRSVFERVYNQKISSFDNLLQNINEVQTSEEYRTRLKLYIEQYYVRMSANLDFFNLIQKELVEGMPRLENLLRAFFSITQRTLVEYLSFGLKKKYIKKDVDPNLAASSLMILLSGFVQQQKLNKPDMFFSGINSKDVSERLVKTINTIFFDGVMQ